MKVLFTAGRMYVNSCRAVGKHLRQEVKSYAGETRSVYYDESICVRLENRKSGWKSRPLYVLGENVSERSGVESLIVATKPNGGLHWKANVKDYVFHLEG